MYLQYSTKADLLLNLGSCFYTPNSDETAIEKTLIINPKPNFGYHAKNLLKALNSGVISQEVYNIITENENETRQYYALDSNFALDKTILINLINSFGLLGYDTTGDALSILLQLNANNYQLISNI